MDRRLIGQIPTGARCACCGDPLYRYEYAGRPPRFCKDAACQRRRRDGQTGLERRLGHRPTRTELAARSRAAKPQPLAVPPGHFSTWPVHVRQELAEQAQRVFADAHKRGYRIADGWTWELMRLLDHAWNGETFARADPPSRTEDAHG